MKGLMTFVSGVLSVIAVGVLLVAYGLFNPRTTAADAALANASIARPMYAGDRVTLTDDADRLGAYPSRQLTYPGYAVPASDVRAVPAVETYQAPRRATVARPVSYQPRSTPVARSVERSSGRDWKKMAMIIGGSSAAGAGLGAIVGGKKGALIGAAIGGGASTIYEMKKR
jgi:hypothetical protein